MRLLGVAAIAAALGGCAVGKPLPKAFHDALQQVGGAEATASLDDLSPTAPDWAVFRLYEGGDTLAGGEAGATLSRTVELTPDGSQLRITRLRSRSTQESAAEGAEDVEMASTLVPFEGGWAMTRAETPGRGVITQYEPPMLVYPPSIAPGQALSQDVNLIVRPIDDRQRIQNRGAATNTIELVGRQTVRTALGSVEALRVRTTFVGSFGVARVQRITDSWHAPGLGLVAEEVHERVTALGAPVSAIDQGLLLIAIDGQTPAASSDRSTSESDSSQ